VLVHDGEERDVDAVEDAGEVLLERGREVLRRDDRALSVLRPAPVEREPDDGEREQVQHDDRDDERASHLRGGPRRHRGALHRAHQPSIASQGIRASGGAA
jgi:hypothetical protein